jgi:hypothetical protein
MIYQENSNEIKPKIRHDSLHRKLAFQLGKTVQKASKTVAAVKKASRRRLTRKTGQKPGKNIMLVDSMAADTPHEPISPILKEIKAIAEISGLLAAVQEMNEISFKRSNHPIVDRLTARIEQLSPREQEMLSMKFIERLKKNTSFIDPVNSFSPTAKMTEADCQKISDAFIESVFFTLEDVGLTQREREFLQKFSDEMTRPINELVQFYLHPKTFKQKVKRLWRIQRILVKMIKLINKTNAFASASGESFEKTAAKCEL